MQTNWVIPSLLAFAGLLALLIQSYRQRTGKPQNGFGVVVFVIACWIVALIVLMQKLKA